MSYNALGEMFYNLMAHFVKIRRFKCLIIFFDMLKKNYLSFRPKKCKKKTNNTTKYIKMEISFISSKLTKREVEKEKVLLYSYLAKFTL